MPPGHSVGLEAHPAELGAHPAELGVHSVGLEAHLVELGWIVRREVPGGYRHKLQKHVVITSTMFNC